MTKRRNRHGQEEETKGQGSAEIPFVQNRKKAKALIRELGLEFVSVEKVEEDRHQT